MSIKFKQKLKSVVAGLLCAVSLSNMVMTSIPVIADAKGSSEILGTNTALGSPILNGKATTDNWNKWEIVTWGVFLSNFCQPLLDTYESAFSTSSGTGSRGAGYKALCFGSGSDSANNDTVKDFCTYAIQTEMATTPKTIYVGYTHITSDSGGVKVGDRPDPNSVDDASKILREATLDDFFFHYDSDVTYDANDVKNCKTSIIYSNNGESGDGSYSARAYISEGSIPTFYIKSATNAGKYKVIFDYLDAWDLQSFASMCNGIHTDKSTADYGKQFSDALGSLYGTSKPVGLDCFGNIVMQDFKMVVPASINQNITTEKSINILNSWMMNGYINSCSADTAIQGLHQSHMDKTFDVTDVNFAGLPAFGDSTKAVNGSGFFYYDMDAAALAKETSNNKSKYLDYMQELFDQDIESDSNTLPLEYEVAGNMDMSYVYPWTNTDNAYKVIESTIMSSSILMNYVTKTSNNKQPAMLTKLINTDGKEVSMFGEKSVVVPVQAVLDENDKGTKHNGKYVRAFYNWLYQVYSGNITDTTSSLFNRDSLLDILKSSDYNGTKDVSDLNDATDVLWQKFQACNPEYRNVKEPKNWNDVGGNESIDDDCSRLVKVYLPSAVMQSVASVLDIKDGTEFKTYSTMIYMTYLDWYGVINKNQSTGGTEAQSKFSEEVYDPTSDLLNVNPSDITNMISEDDLESEVLQMSYLMLSPESGRDYRKKLVFNGVADFLYEQYNRIVYGGSSSIYTGETSKSNSGFLAVPTFSENFLTSWFLDNYVDVAVILIMTCVVILVIIGLLKGRKFSWFILGMFTIVNVILLVPSSGEITPAVTKTFTQKIFSNKMNFWTISEGVANAEIEANEASKTKEFEGLTDEQASIVKSLVNQLSVIYTDRSLMLKQDISQKLTQPTNDSIYSDIQSIQSARWILPMVMQQFSASDQDTDSYVYTKLSNVWDDASNIYWYYYPTAAGFVTKETATSGQFSKGTAKTADNNTNTGNGGKNKISDGATSGNYIKTAYYTDYKEASWKNDTSTKMNYANYSYTLRDNDNDNVHLYSYILHDQNLSMNSTSLSRESVFGKGLANYKDADSWQSWIDKANSTLQKKQWATNKDGAYAYETISDQYDRTDTSTLHDGYGYYKTTESPYYYFFNVVQDSMPADKSVGAVIGRLQGQIKKDSTDTDVRSNFMYATTTTNKEKENSGSGNITNSDVVYTPYVRDVLDLQEFFTNTVPYMYEMTLAAGGFDGESGILGKDTITEESDLYEGNPQSWAYRCNWAVKLMENKNFNEPQQARLKDGKKVTIQNPLLPESYEAVGRNMVFSEAQKEAYGLTDKDLTLVELKCIEVNKAAAKDWTLMINYAGTDGLTKEVLLRTMATAATESFCKEFSSSGVLDTRYEIYPQSVDLRYLSFDAIMKMLMVNVSKNTSYAYGDTMDTLLNDSDLVTAFMLLLCSVLCVWVIPFAQQLIMAAIFYLGFIAIIRALFSSAAYKGRVAGAQVVSNVLFMVYTIAYYFMISMLMTLSSTDEVLSVDKIKSSPGNPVWMLLIVIVISCVYVFAMYKHLCFCFAHYRDMGAEMIGFVTSTVVGKLQDTAGSIRDGIFDAFSGNESTGGGASSTGGTGSISGTGVAGESTQNVNIVQSNDSTIKVNKTTDTSDDMLVDDSSSTTYSSGETVQSDYGETSADIDAEIKAGEKLGSD